MNLLYIYPKANENQKDYLCNSLEKKLDIKLVEATSDLLEENYPMLVDVQTNHEDYIGFVDATVLFNDSSGIEKKDQFDAWIALLASVKLAAIGIPVLILCVEESYATMFNKWQYMDTILINKNYCLQRDGHDGMATYDGCIQNMRDKLLNMVGALRPHQGYLGTIARLQSDKTDLEKKHLVKVSGLQNDKTKVIEELESAKAELESAKAELKKRKEHFDGMDDLVSVLEVAVENKSLVEITNIIKELKGYFSDLSIEHNQINPAKII